MVKNIEIEVMQVTEINEDVRKEVENFIGKHVSIEGTTHKYLEFIHCTLIFPNNWIVKYKNGNVDILCDPMYKNLF